MKTVSYKAKSSGFTLVEILVVIALIAILAAILLPVHPHHKHKPAYRIICESNLKQIDLGFRMYADDNGGNFQIQLPVTNDGTSQFSNNLYAVPNFRKLSAYVGNPAILVCPIDKDRKAATNFESLKDINISYFLNADASFTNNPSNTTIAGDRNLTANGKPVKSGVFLMTTNFDMSWTREIHSVGGNLAFADGHVEWTGKDRLNTVVQSQPFATNHILVP